MSEPVTDFDDEVIGHGLPEAASACIRDAGRVRSAEPLRALALLQRARQIAPEHPATLIALYRFQFYGHQLAAARETVTEAIGLGARFLGVSPRWQEVRAAALPGARFDPRTRFYLFALKAYAYLCLRLDDLQAAEQALALLRGLDPEDRVGAALLTQVMVRRGLEEEDDPLDAGVLA